MKVCVLLLLVCVCVCRLCWRTDALSSTYLVTAPLSLRVDALEKVLLQLFGFTEEVRVYVYLKTSMGPDQVVLAQDVVTLNTNNDFQAAAVVRLDPGQLDRTQSHVILHVQSPHFNQHQPVPISRTNGFMFIQTDKPLYTPDQSVKVRVVSLNQELRPANRSVYLSFKDPDQSLVDTVELIDFNNGIPSMQDPFKIPIKPKLGIWSIEASYSEDFTTTARTDFEVKEYVLPRFSILVEPDVNYISFSGFKSFHFKVSVRYVHGAPVADGVVLLRYGHVSGKSPPVIIPRSRSKVTLSHKGEAAVTVNLEEVLSQHAGPVDFSSLVGKYLYVTVLLLEATGGISQEAEFATVKFVTSPYSLSLVSTPAFIKPGLPFNIQVLVKDHLGKPVNRVEVRLAEQQIFTQGGVSNRGPCDNNDRSISQSDGLAFFICNTQGNSNRVVLRFQTADPALPEASQASLRFEAVAYRSPNSRYLYIDPPPPGRHLRVGDFTNINVYSSTSNHIPFSYMVVSRGKVLEFGRMKSVSASDNKQTVRFQVKPSMVPSLRLLVFYVLTGENTAELVADSVWLDVKDKCVNGLKTGLSFRHRDYKPKETVDLMIDTNDRGLVALSVVDSALHTLRPTYRDPVTMVLRHIEQSDLGCGGGGGKDSADVFRLAGLTFMTNANAHPSDSSEPCTAAVRVKRSLTKEQKRRKDKVASYPPPVQQCCERGMGHSPFYHTCAQFADMKTRNKSLRCRRVFIDCCMFLQEEQDQNLALARHVVSLDDDLPPSLVRSFFPESWMWEVQPVSAGVQTFSRSLPDSLTTWEFTAVGVFSSGVCVAEPAHLSVNLQLSVDVPLPYQVIRGEQLELRGSVYNQLPDDIDFCVTLTAGPALCLQQSRPSAKGAGLHSTGCSWSRMSAGDVRAVKFTVLGLEVGEHLLTFSLKTQQGHRDVVQRSLRVVPEGLKKERFSAGILDPQGLYGSVKRSVELRNSLPPNIVPNTAVERQLTLNGEVLGDVLTLLLTPEGLRQLVHLPPGSAEAELGHLQPLAQVYQYLETTRTWDLLGPNIQKNSADLRRKIREGVISISSFRNRDYSYSMWMKREASTWLSALAVKTLVLVDQIFPVDHQVLSLTLGWIIRNQQLQDGSFNDTSSFRANKFMATSISAVDRSVYMTSFVLISLNRATKIRDKHLQLQFLYDSMSSAADYISQHAPGVQSVYVRAVATYALTLHDPMSQTASLMFNRLKSDARRRGNPPDLMFWHHTSDGAADWLMPDQSSALTVETTAYALMTVLLKGRIQDANPILSWLTHDQNYGEALYSAQDTALTLEAITEYSKVARRSVLLQDINIMYRSGGELGSVQLSQSRPVATPIQVTKDDVISVTGSGGGVSVVKMKTVYYQTTASTERCNFDLSIEVQQPNPTNPRITSPTLVTCAKYRPPPNELMTDSTLTVMEIQLPTGVEAYLEDLRQLTDFDEPIISRYELQGNTVVIQMDSVPSETSLCIGFRLRNRIRVIGATKSVLTVYEPQDTGSRCTKQFSYQQVELQSYCVDQQCQCMTAACATYRSNMDLSLTEERRVNETCRPHVRYAYRLTVMSSAAEGDYITYTATVEEILKRTHNVLAVVQRNSPVDLVLKSSCSFRLQLKHQYLLMGATGSELRHGYGYKVRLLLDSEVLVDPWPPACSTPECLDYVSHLDDLSVSLQLSPCPSSPEPL